MKIAFTTLGCKVNQFDTAIMSEEAARENNQVVPYEEKADLYVINTCTVTENADLESRLWVKKALVTNPNAKIIVTGCYAQTNPSEVQKIAGVNLILGNEEKKKITSYLPMVHSGSSSEEHTEQVSCVWEISREKLFKQPLIESFLDKTRAFLKVQDGCNAWCSFCVIPQARGRSRSFRPDEIIAQIRLFEEKGYREAVFTGINLGAYGLDLSPKSSLLSLFRHVERETGNIRIRFSSIEPDYFTDELIDAFTASDRVCRHFHIPLQSGHSGILKKMNRKYTPDDYRRTVERIHRQIPDAGIGMDVMVGFPGESSKEFEATFQMISDLPVSYLHIFPYSPREKTAASLFPGHVSSEEKKERARRLRQLGQRKGDYFRSQFIGKSLNLLVEENREHDPTGMRRGLSDNYIKIIIEDAPHLKPNQLISVVPHSLQKDKLIAKLL